MPAIQVARTDTFEIQRQKINQIGNQIFNISAGGSDLSTGNLKLGDGSIISPSLAFTNENSLGIFKTTDSEFGFVRDEKQILNIGLDGLISFKDVVLKRRYLYTEGLTVTSPGQNYDAGSYSAIALLGGTGEDATANITVTEFVGTITNNGLGYFDGQFSNVLLEGGNGTGAIISFDVLGIEGDITNAGSGYVAGSYEDVPLTGGSGSGATADVTIVGSSELAGNVTNTGSGYQDGDYQLVGTFNTPTQTFVVTTTANPGTPPPDNVYVIDGNVQQVLSLEKGNTYRFDTSDASMVGHPLVFNLGGNALPGSEFITKQSSAQLGTSGSFVDLIIKPTASLNTIQYACSSHSGMGGNISIITGTTAQYGSGAAANITVSNGSVSAVSWTTAGIDYQNGDVLTIDTLGGTGSGFVFSVTGVVYTGVVDTFTIVESGVSYVNSDILSFNNSDVGGSGSGFAFTVNNSPSTIQEVVFSSKGEGYQTNDVLTLPRSKSFSSVTLRGRVQDVTTTLSTASSIITVADTDGIIAGMGVTADLNQPGQVPQGTTVQSVDSSTQITLSANPSSDGTALLTFQSSGSLTGISVPNTTGIQNGYRVFVLSGSGVLDPNTVIAGVNEQQSEITISPQATKAGIVDLLITPPFGDPATDFEFTVGNLGVISDISVEYGGSGYVIDDSLSVLPSDLTQPEEIDVTVREVINLSFTNTIPSGTFSVGDVLKLLDGEIESFSVGNTSSVPAAAGNSYTNIPASGGNGSGASFDATRDQQGGVSFIINNAGRFYQNGDVLTILGSAIGGSSPTDDVQITISGASSTTEREIYRIFLDGSNNVESVIVQNTTLEPLSSGDLFYKVGSSTTYTLDIVGVSEYRFFMVTGNGVEPAPDFTFYVGNSYKFNLSNSSLDGHSFSLSKYRDGIWSPSKLENVTTTLSDSSAQITVASTSNISPGMSVVQQQVVGDTGNISPGTFVESVDSATTLTLSQVPDISGTATLTFAGVEYVDGVTKESGSLTVKVTDDTPTLYYYCSSHPNMGGKDNAEAVITIDPNNPKTFGSGFVVQVGEINISDNIVADNETGDFTCVTLNANDANVTEAVITGSLTTPSITSTNITATSIASTAQLLTVNAPTTRFTGGVNLGTTIQMVSSNGNITTNGVLRTNGSFNVDNKLVITGNTISTQPTFDLVIDPANGQLVKIDSITALQIPVGDTLERPVFSGAAGNGSIRFNTETNQYEGYNASTTSWSSLGGVRDIDGNTYILAELTAGANDNTLWFYNDSVNTLKLTSEFMDFRSVKKISSTKLGLPSYTVWAANTPVTIGQYIKYRNNLYEVTGSGVTATVGSEPTHTSGVANNGTAQFTWYSSSVSPLSFTEIQELRVAPNKDASLIVNQSLKLGGTTSDDWNTISTVAEDLTLEPYDGKKVVIKSNTHLAIPAGNNNQKNTASAVAGSIRFNTEIQQYEGYSGTNWSSLGGVRDVDGNTYIIPETAPAANENILYFYNDNLNTMQLSKTSLDFTNIDTITTSGLNNLSLDTPLVTLNLNETTIDNREVTRTFISSSKQYLDLGLSSGLNVDPILRLDDQGDVYLNTTFGSGSFNGVKVFDGELKEFELADYALRTTSFSLGKGAAETSAVNLYPTSTNKGCKVTVVSKSSSGKRSMTEYHVIDNGTDIFYNEFGSLNTSLDQYTASFDYNAGEVRITLTLSGDHANGDIISFTVLNQVIK